jgi:hypothetical protein
MSAPGIEQRRAPRLNVPPTGGPIAVIGARLLNVSSFGVLIEAPLPMTAPDVQPLRLSILGEKHDVEARVIDCRAAADKRRAYHVGLEFLSLSPAAKERLADALHQLAGNVASSPPG